MLLKLCYFLLYYTSVVSNDIFSLIYDYDHNLYYCVTNSSSALTWISESPTKKSVFFPKRDNVDCNFRNSTTCEQYEPGWAPILDRRWENLETINGTDELRERILLPQDEHFSVPFSLRTKKGANLFVCNNILLKTPDCYWFSLFSKKNEIVIQKCKNYTSGNESQRCKDEKKFNLQNYSPDEIWFHFEVLKLKDNSFSFKSIVNQSVNFNASFDMKHLYISRGSWKFHVRKPNIYIRKETSMARIGPTEKDLTFCINFFLLMCANCRMNLTLNEANVPKNILKKGTFKNKNNLTEWIEVKFSEDNFKNKNLFLSISTYILGNSSKPYWFIDNIRMCSPNEVRVITSKEKLKCQLITEQQNLILDLDISNESSLNLNNNRSKNVTSIFCRRCLKSATAKICKVDESRRSYCNIEYPRRLNNCNSDCTYKENDAEIPLVPVFLMAPKIISVGYTEVNVLIDDFQVFDYLHNISTSFKIQYKEENGSWTDYKNKFNFGKNSSTRITGLSPGTKNFVRGVIMPNDKEEYIEDRIPLTQFTTKCDEIIENDIEIYPSNISLILFVAKKELSRLCSFEKLKILQNSSKTEILPKVRNTTTAYFENLNPYTVYDVTFQSSFRKQFQTSEGIPEKITNLSVLHQSNDSISLKWNAPQHIYGRLKHYTVEYQHISYLGCNQSHQTKNTSSEIVNTTAITLLHLKEYSTYRISVYAVNFKFDGTHAVLFANTSSADIIQDKEIFNNITVSTAATNARIQFFSFLNCSEFRGPLRVNVMANCSEVWCKNITLSYYCYSVYELHQISGLTPFQSYSLKVQFCREFSCTATTKISFKTAPDVPQPIDSLLVYTKNSSSVSLRWKNPYPPTGVPEFFQIGYSICGSTRINITNVISSKCRIWRQYNCYTLTQLEENQTYCIEIKMKNKDVEQLSTSSATQTITKIEESEAPYDLDLKWSGDLELKWKHPNNTNGPIEKFYVSLQIVSTKVIFSKILDITQDDYRLVYEYTVKSKELQPSTKYWVTVFAANSLKGHVISRKTISPADIGEDVPPFLTFYFLFIGVLIIALILIFVIWLGLHMFFKKSKDVITTNEEQILLTPFTIDNISENVESLRPVRLQEFENYVKKAFENGELIKQHKSILEKTSKSNYEKIGTIFFYEYLNVCIDYVKIIPKAYIVADIPNPKNVNNFWRTIWNENVKQIILLDNKNDFVYWPKEHKSLIYENILVKLHTVHSFTHYKRREFILVYQQKTKNISQLCFSSWPHNNVPDSVFSLLPFFSEMSNIQLGSKSPILVHSSYGLQITGFVLLCDISLRKSKSGYVEVFKVAQLLSQCLVELIVDLQFFLFAHLLLLEKFLVMHSNTSCDLMKRKLINGENVSRVFENLETMSWVDETVQAIKRQGKYGSDNHNYSYIDRISVITIDNLQNFPKVFVTKQPTQYTLTDFWNFVEKYNVATILSLSDCQEFMWFPTREYKKISISKISSIRYSNTKNCSNYESTYIILDGQSKNDITEIRSLKANYSEDVATYVDFCTELTTTSSGRPIVALCSDGITACGALVAMIYNIEQMKIEKNCNLYAAVRFAKSHHMGFVKQQQFSLLWEATKIYVEKYVNIK